MQLLQFYLNVWTSVLLTNQRRSSSYVVPFTYRNRSAEHMSCVVSSQSFLYKIVYLPILLFLKITSQLVAYNDTSSYVPSPYVFSGTMHPLDAASLVPVRSIPELCFDYPSPVAVEVRENRDSLVMDALLRGHIVQRTHRPMDASSKGCIVQGT
jgi:hypothetical protein